MAPPLAGVLFGTPLRSAATSLTGGWTAGSLFGDGDNPVSEGMETVELLVMALVGLVAVFALGQLFNIDLGG